jgi:hypothetical protein
VKKVNERREQQDEDAKGQTNQAWAVRREALEAGVERASVDGGRNQERGRQLRRTDTESDNE